MYEVLGREESGVSWIDNRLAHHCKIRVDWGSAVIRVRQHTSGFLGVREDWEPALAEEAHSSLLSYRKLPMRNWGSAELRDRYSLLRMSCD